MNVFRIGPEQRVAEARDALIEEQRLASSMAVLTQVHISRIRYDQSIKTYELAGLYNDVALRIHEQTRTSAQHERVSELALIRESLNALLAELRRDVAFADLQNSFGRVFMSMGLDLVPENYSEGSLAALTQDIAQRFTRWQLGDLSVPAPVIEQGAQHSAQMEGQPEAQTGAEPVIVSDAALEGGKEPTP